MNSVRSGPALDIQVVLFETPLLCVWRLLEGLSASTRLAEEQGLLSNSTLRIGDCSPHPALHDKDILDLRKHARANNLTDFQYDFFDSNLGHSGGHNRLASSSEADLLLLLNPDTYPAPTMLVELLTTLQDERIGIAEARQIPVEHPKEFDPTKGDTSWASACCIAIRTQVFRSVAGFDEQHLPVYCNDVDLSWRLRLRGFRVVLAPRALVFHDKQISSSGEPVQTPSEAYHAALGRLILASRYDRPDVVYETISALESSESVEQKMAVTEFRIREQNNTLPEPIPEASRVAQFVDGEYARHRW